MCSQLGMIRQSGLSVWIKEPLSCQLSCNQVRRSKTFQLGVYVRRCCIRIRTFPGPVYAVVVLVALTKRGTPFFVSSTMQH